MPRQLRWLGLFFHLLGIFSVRLIVWLVKRGDSPEIDEHGKESLNFQISMLIYNVIAADSLPRFDRLYNLGALHMLNTVLVIIASIQGERRKILSLSNDDPAD